MTDEEVDRIRAFYVDRTSAVGDRWSPRLPSQMALDAGRRRVWCEFLVRTNHHLGRVLEIGCGSGGVLRWALEAGAVTACGVDVQQPRLAAAREMRRSGEAYVMADGRRLPFPDDAFDTVVCSLLMTTFLDQRVRTSIASEIDRVLQPDGAVLYFDMIRENRSNPHIRAVRKREVKQLLPGFAFWGQTVVLAPPLARRLERHSRLMSALELVPPLRTHIAGGFTRHEAPATAPTPAARP